MFCNKCGNEIAENGFCPNCEPGYVGRHGHIHHHLPTSGLAVAGMILGIVSGLLWILTAIPGLILSIIGLVKINNGERKGKGFAVAGIIMNGMFIFFPAFLGIIAIMAGMLLPALGSAREKARRISCTSNLKQIGLSIKQYAMDYQDCFPNKDGAAGMEQLRANDYLTDYGVYTCPSTDTADGKGSESLTGHNCDYIYFGGFMEGSSDQYGVADTPLAFDNPANHTGYINVLFHDGHVQGFGVPQDVKTAAQVVEFLSYQFKYPPVHLKILQAKAAKTDAEQLMK